MLEHFSEAREHVSPELRANIHAFYEAAILLTPKSESRALRVKKLLWFYTRRWLLIHSTIPFMLS